jgi:hypothetical protein
MASRPSYFGEDRTLVHSAGHILAFLGRRTNGCKDDLEMIGWAAVTARIALRLRSIPEERVERRVSRTVK